MLRSRSLKYGVRAAIRHGALLLLVLLSTTAVMAQKKGGTTPPPPPPGSVFFEMNTIHGIKTDGTSPTNTGLPGFNGRPRPSSRVYGADPLKDRWFLRSEEVGYDSVNDRWMTEVVAYHPIRGRVQVTHFDPEIVVSGYLIEWSNGGDAFVSVVGHDVTWTAGQPTLNASHIFRLWVSGDDIDAAALVGEDLMLTPTDPRSEAALTDLEQTTDRLYGAHHWSPDGLRVVYQIGQDMEVADVVTGTVTRVFSSPNSTSSPQWSRPGDKIVFSSGPDIYTIAPDGSALRMVADGTTGEAYTDPFWSPDGAHMAFRMVKASGLNRDTYIVRAPAAGGSYTILTGSLDKRAWKSPLGWVGN